MRRIAAALLGATSLALASIGCSGGSDEEQVQAQSPAPQVVEQTDQTDPVGGTDQSTTASVGGEQQERIAVEVDARSDAQVAEDVIETFSEVLLAKVEDDAISVRVRVRRLADERVEVQVQYLNQLDEWTPSTSEIALEEIGRAQALSETQAWVTDDTYVHLSAYVSHRPMSVGGGTNYTLQYSLAGSRSWRPIGVTFLLKSTDEAQVGVWYKTPVYALPSEIARYAPVLFEQVTDGYLSYSARRDPLDDTVLTTISVRAVDGELVLTVACEEGGGDDALVAALVNGPRMAAGERVQVQLRLDDGELSLPTSWLAADIIAVTRDSREFLDSLRNSSKLAIRMLGRRDATGVRESETAVFDLTGLFETPLQPNIDRCGEY